MSPRKVEFFIPGPLPGMNEIIAACKGVGGRGLSYSGMKKVWTDAGVWQLRRAKPIPAPIFISFTWVERDKRRNPDNVAAGKKFILDSLVKARVIPNDGWGEIAGWEDRFEVASVGNPVGVKVIVFEAESPAS